MLILFDHGTPAPLRRSLIRYLLNAPAALGYLVHGDNGCLCFHREFLEIVAATNAATVGSYQLVEM